VIVRKGLVILAAAVLAALAYAAIARAAPSCLREVRGDGPDFFAYKFRDGRCEGRYGQGLSGVASITFVSFTAFFQSYDFDTGTDLEVSWHSPDAAATTIIARSLEPGKNYQMDTSRMAGETTFAWPISFLSGLDIDQEGLGVVAYYEASLQSRERRVHVPLTVEQTRAESVPSEMRLLARSEVALSRVSRTLERLAVDGASVEVLVDDEPLQRPDFSANWSFPVGLDKAQSPGLYRLSISASVSDSEATIVEDFYFYISDEG
jgi:hypothetical protein